MGQGASAFMTKANPLIGIATTGLNIGMSLVEASKQKELQRAADRQAEKSAAEQERLLSQDFYTNLQVPMEAYDKQFAANTAAQQQALSALTEGDPRLLLGGVGKVQAATVDANSDTADNLAEKLYNLDMTQAGAAERANLRLAPLEAERLKGAQEASAAAQMAKVQAQQKALGAGGDLIKGLGAMIPEYSKTDINANNTDMSTVLKPMGMANSGLNAASQLSENTSVSLNPLYKQYSWGSLAAPGIESQLQSGTANALGDMQNKYGWMDQLAKFGAVRF